MVDDPNLTPIIEMDARQCSPQLEVSAPAGWRSGAARRSTCGPVPEWYL